MAVTLADVATNVVALAAFLTALGVLSRLRPVKWLWRHVVKDPLSGWFRVEVGAVVNEQLEPLRAELSFNGGATTKDAVARVEVTTQELASAMKRIESAVSSADHALAIHIEKFHPPKENNP